MEKSRPAKILALALLLAVVALTLTGCWSARQIEEIAFIMAIGVDKDGEQIKVSVQIAVNQGGAGEEGGAASSPVWVASVKGNSFSEAIFRLKYFVAREPFWSHAMVLVIGEEQARAGIADILDFMERDRQFRDRMSLAVTLGTAEEILKVEPKMMEMPSEYLEQLLQRGVSTGVIPETHLLSAIIARANRPRMEMMLPLIQTMLPEDTEGARGDSQPPEDSSTANGDEQSPEAIELKGTAVFKDDKMVGTLDNTESRGVSWLMGSISDGLVAIDSVEGHIVTQRVRFTQVKYGVQSDDGIVSITAKVRQEGDLNQWTIREHDITASIIRHMEDDLVREIERDIRSALGKLQREFNSDVVGLGEQIRRREPKLFASLDWELFFPELQVELEIEASFRRMGLTSRQ